MPNLRTRITTVCSQLFRSCGLGNKIDAKEALTKDLAEVAVLKDHDHHCSKDIVDVEQEEEGLTDEICSCAVTRVHDNSDNRQRLLDRTSVGSCCSKCRCSRIRDSVATNTCKYFNMESKSRGRRIFGRILRKFHRRGRHLSPKDEQIEKGRGCMSPKKNTLQFTSIINNKCDSALKDATECAISTKNTSGCALSVNDKSGFDLPLKDNSRFILSNRNKSGCIISTVQKLGCTSSTQKNNAKIDTPAHFRRHSNSRGDSSQTSQPTIQNIYRKPLSRLSAYQAPPSSVVVLCPISELSSRPRLQYNTPPYSGRRQWDSEPTDVCSQSTKQPLCSVDITTAPSHMDDEQFRRRVFTMPSLRNNLFNRQMNEANQS